MLSLSNNGVLEDCFKAKAKPNSPLAQDGVGANGRQRKGSLMQVKGLLASF